ncbi:MAG: TetR/AcrR family transcriptional regulator [Ardenticatenaceae bacterium]|nr:TetR/AcrR family transcriptional regulator [Anaerolineales bacterium]MCB8920278.1 TetR/AcrR family transcriptional regulator [Ardenticatenaceae bacterium]
MSPRRDVSEERKSQILDAAEAVFMQKGFENARMEDIAQGAGLSKGTLYLYYNSKDELIVAILDRIFERDFTEMENLDVTGMTAVAAIWQFVAFATAETSAMLHLLPIAYEYLSLAFRNETVQAALKQYFNQYLDILLPLIQHGINTGEFRQVDAKEIAIAIGAIFEGTIILWVYDKSLVDPIQNTRTSLELLLEGILSKS